MIHYDFLTLQNYILTFLSSLLLGTDTLCDFAFRRVRKSCNRISWWTDNWSSFLFLFTETCTKNIKWNYTSSSIYPPMSPKYYTLKLLHREIPKTKKIFVTEIKYNKIRKSHPNYKITMYSTTDINWNGSAIFLILKWCCIEIIFQINYKNFHPQAA